MFWFILAVLLVMCVVVGTLGRKGDFVPPSRDYTKPRI